MECSRLQKYNGGNIRRNKYNENRLGSFNRKKKGGNGK